MFGKGTPLIYINGRLVQDKNELAQLNSQDIKNVEVITNPGSKYDAFIAKGFGMEVAAYDAFCPADVIEAAGVHAVKSQDELFQTCDIVSLHIPATPETIKSIDYKTVNQLPKGGILINTARKEVINEPELLKLLAEREDLKFITDIKPDADADFAKFEGRYFSTPKKMGAQTAEANINAGIAAAKQINAFFKDGCTKFQVNK